MADAISIEETNRLRVSLGMKPLPVPGAGPVFRDPSATAEEAGSTLESRQAECYDNYRKLKDAEEAKRKREEKAEAIKRARDTAKRFSKLEGKGLGDTDDDEEMSAKAWLMKQKKRQKEIEKARKREQELAAAEAAAEYTARDLAGVKVGHELDTFQEGEDQVLTLKDTTIDENEEEGDELENLELREREKLTEKLELKKKKPNYNPHEVDETGETSILAHYDEEIDGKKRQRFTLDGMGSTTEASIERGTAKKIKPKVISLDLFKDDEPKSDYLELSEIKVKKPKKKKAKSTRQKAVDEDDILPISDSADMPVENADSMEVDQPGQAKKRTYDNISFVDDEDLQASLAAQRRNALKKRQRLRPEELAQQLKEEESVMPAADNGVDDEGGLVIDETSEFVANLQKPTAHQSKRRSTSRQADVTTMGNESDGEGDVDMDRTYANVEDEEDLIARLKREESISEDMSNGLEQEATLSRGLGSTLKLLKDRGIIKTADSGDLNAIFIQKQKFLAEKQRREADAEKKARQQRERDRANGRLDKMSAREKEEYARSQNAFRDQVESRQLAEHFNREYRPNVEIKHIDEYGRLMNQKDAFKHLSHQFHGKGSGKQKTEKLLKKIEDEKRREAQSSLDGSQMGGMSGATAQQRKKRGQAGVRLA
ncbi:U4/U6.U5 tri-snRNP-associated protein snu66 [Diplocarpon rosae]|nr:U4/U6.U5 tri-snRNP-associated protein snu66 [Diplocarpon rosae]